MTARGKETARQNLSPEAVHRALEAVLSSSSFGSAPRLSAFLRYVVEQTLAGGDEQLKEYSIAIEVFERNGSFDPATDTIVRVQARRVRQKLSEYYADAGRTDPIVIELPKGAYVPTFRAAERRGGSPRLRWAIAAAGLACAALLSSFYLPRADTADETASLSVVPDLLTETILTNDRGEERGPSFSPDGSRVAYAARGREADDSWNIYVEVIGSGQPRQITHSPSHDLSPAWSRDGLTIAFERRTPLDLSLAARGFGNSGPASSRAELRIVPADGGRARKVHEFERRTLAGIGISWSPDGERLAFSGRPGPEGPVRIGLLTIGDDEAQWLTSPETGILGDKRPGFSPDGSQLVFVRHQGVTSGLNVFVLSLSSDFKPLGSPRQLTQFDRVADDPAWMPDGEEILFAGEQGPGQEGIWSVSASGDEEPRLLWRRTGLRGALAVARNPAGDVQIAYEVRLEFDSDIYRVNLTGARRGEAVPLISTTLSDGGGEYSPDGSRIAFATGTPAREVWVCDADGGGRRRLAALGSRIISPLYWSPNGRKIVFHARPGGASDLYVVDADSGRLEQLTDSDYDDAVPTWSRDGRWIYFASNRSGDWAVWKILAEGGEAELVMDRHRRTITESMDGRLLFFNDPETGDFEQLPLGDDRARPSLMVEGANRTIVGFQVAPSGLYFVSGAGMLSHYDPERKSVKELLAVEGIVTSVHPDETSVLTVISNPRETDLRMLELQR